jgi:hypothetical protein
MAEIQYNIALRSYPTDYSYEHFNPRQPSQVVYVGRGSGSRAWSSDQRSPAHLVWMREWQCLGFAPDEYVRIVVRKLTPQEAIEKEKQVLAHHAMKGCLRFNDALNEGPVRQHENKFFPDGPRRDTNGRWKGRK